MISSYFWYRSHTSIAMVKTDSVMLLHCKAQLSTSQIERCQGQLFVSLKMLSLTLIVPVVTFW